MTANETNFTAEEIYAMADHRVGQWDETDLRDLVGGDRERKLHESAEDAQSHVDEMDRYEVRDLIHDGWVEEFRKSPDEATRWLNDQAKHETASARDLLEEFLGEYRAAHQWLYE